MIISETGNKILRVSFSPDNWLQIQTFDTRPGLKDPSKLIMISPEDQSTLVKFILDRAQDIQQIKMNELHNELIALDDAGTNR